MPGPVLGAGEGVENKRDTVHDHKKSRFRVKIEEDNRAQGSACVSLAHCKFQLTF